MLDFASLQRTIIVEILAVWTFRKNQYIAIRGTSVGVSDMLVVSKLFYAIFFAL